MRNHVISALISEILEKLPEEDIKHISIDNSFPSEYPVKLINYYKEDNPMYILKHERDYPTLKENIRRRK